MRTKQITQTSDLRKYATHIKKLIVNFQNFLLLRALRAVYKPMNFFLVLMSS